jgi:mersacidin/lichenicidin family type 2 lantibiotic
MRKVDLVRAWKDPVYRASLSAEERAGLAVHPAGILELDEEMLALTAGGIIRTTFITCTEYTFSQSLGCCPKA